MSSQACLCADTIGFPQGGGHTWAYLNWAQGLKSVGFDVIWLEEVSSHVPLDRLQMLFAELRRRLEPFGFGGRIAILQRGIGCMAHTLGCTPFEEAADAEVLINLKYALEAHVVKRFRRSVLVDIDPGMLQIWMHSGVIEVAPHDLYFSIGETVGTHDALFPGAGLEWHYTPPPVALDSWPVSPPGVEAFRTVTTWWNCNQWLEHDGESYDNSKRAGFLPYIDLPRRTSQKLELALCLSQEEEDRADLEANGWSVRRADQVAGSPMTYQTYIQGAKGEFSCAKPSYVRLQTAWVSDRTVCFLASGKPAVVRHTGPSRFLPDRQGLLRFEDPCEAGELLEAVANDYESHTKAARALAEEWFDARQVIYRILSRI
jgi:hypothetical protein